MKLLFIYDHQYPEKWRDGLWAALNLLEKRGIELTKVNIQDYMHGKIKMPFPMDFDFVLGWGAFNSEVDRTIQSYADGHYSTKPKFGLCIAGNSFPPEGQDKYDVLFYETEWYLPQIQHHKNVVRAFGINSDIYKPIADSVLIWDYTTVGAFALWKRQHLLKNKAGYKLAIGEIQKGNMSESIKIMGSLLLEGVAVSDMVEPEVLANIYNSSARVYIPAEINGGGERAVLEARACGRPVSVEQDNPKLIELLHWNERSGVPNHHFYSEQLLLGIESCL